jgi:shikimate kinase
MARALAGEAAGGRRLTGRDARVYLVGFMGSGKTTVGRRLAARLGVPFVDLDEAFEAMAGETIRQTFEMRGEAWFRGREAELLRGTADLPAVVVALGGGTFVFPENAAFIRRHGVSVFLDVPFESLARRLQGKTADRPLFQSEGEALRLYEARRPFYTMADLTVFVNDGMTVEDVVEYLALALCAAGGAAGGGA